MISKAIPELILVLLIPSLFLSAYQIQPTNALGTIYIRSDGSIDPPSAPMIRTGDQYILTDTINSDTVGIVIEKNGVSIDGAHHSIQGEDIDSSIGIELANMNNVTVKNMTIMSFHYGIRLQTSSHNRLINCSLSNNSYGIYLYAASNYNRIIGNNMTADTWSDIWLYGSSYNIISGNRLTESPNSLGGIKLELYSDNNTITKNHIAGRKVYGIYVDTSIYNNVYHNSLINNPCQVYIPEHMTNSWDDGYPNGGNYWGDSNITDRSCGPYQNESGSDGISDFPYLIDARNEDRYPLTVAYSPPDIAVTNFTTSKTIVGQGFVLTINVTIKNEVRKVETFEVDVYANATNIACENVTAASGNAFLIFNWNTTSFMLGNYTFEASVLPLPDEQDTLDNVYAWGWVRVSIIGDVNGDSKVDILDLVRITRGYGTSKQEPLYNPNGDIDNDGIITILDVVTCTAHYGERYFV